MTIDAETSTSRRGYLSRAELVQFANITINDENEADDQISQAEEIIDGYVGHQNKFLVGSIKGRSSSAGGNTTFYLDTDQLNVFQKNYFKGMEVEILGGTGEGQRRRITASEYASGKITVSDAWDTNPAIGSFFKIYQLGKFPRVQDVNYYSNTDPEQYYKQIPEAVKRAVSAQVEFVIQMTEAFFNTDKSEKESEKISTYAYKKASGQAIGNKIIAPKAKNLLRGIRNRTGSF